MNDVFDAADVFRNLIGAMHCVQIVEMEVLRIVEGIKVTR